MILSVESDLPGFKSLVFRDGLNVILSTKAEGSKDGHTRNSAGKSSFVELVHFLLGADCAAGDLFAKPALAGHTFRGTFVIAGRPVTVARSGSNQGRILIDANQAGLLGLDTKADKATGLPSVSKEEWKHCLGHAMFGLPATLKGSPYGESYTPGFRSMFSYFARREGSKAFVSPERHAERQSRWDWQVNLSYLLGLEWQVSHDLHGIRQREGMLAELKKAAKGGALGNVVGKSAEIRPKLVLARSRAETLRERLGRFEVVESFKEISAEAASAKTEISAIARRAVVLRENVTYLRQALETEQTEGLMDVERLFQAVGVELPGARIRRHVEQVAAFQKSVVANRRSHLAGEIARAEAELAAGDLRSKELEGTRTKAMSILQTGGGLEDFVALQRHLAEAEADAAALGERLKAAEALEQETTRLNMDRSAIKLRLAENLKASGDIEAAILLVNGAISELYDDRVGSFEVAATDNGPEFRISIPGDTGGGISQMEFFCLDYTLFTLWQKRGKGPGFLIHDSRLFDGVDPRQTLAAIKLGRAVTHLFGGQYVVSLNSDTLDQLKNSDDVDWDAATVQPVLTDREDGGLFGFRFD